ncbi:hypothetical protein [Trichothermofontia sp.]
MLRPEISLSYPRQPLTPNASPVWVILWLAAVPLAKFAILGT